MNRSDLQRLSQDRLLDAEALLHAGRASYAYYTTGYAIECALKSCVLARMIHTGWIFEPKARIEDAKTHDFNRLVELAGLKDVLNDHLKSVGPFAGYWGVVSGWRVESRYHAATDAEARAIFEAATHDPDGVLKWVQVYW